MCLHKTVLGGKAYTLQLEQFATWLLIILSYSKILFSAQGYHV